MDSSAAIVVAGLSTATQLAAAWIALQQMALVTGRYRFAWGCVTVALVLMIERRAAPLWRLLEGETTNRTDAVVGLLISALMCVGILGVSRLFVELGRQRRELETLARTDGLTGLLNRREILIRAQAELDRCQRTARPLSLLLLDLDNFKAVNDIYGHGTGDAVLRTVATTGEARLRRVDAFGRIGGEEFLVVLPETDGNAALATAERLRVAIAAAQVATDRGRVSTTVSIGVITHWAAGDNAATVLLDDLLASADAALYAAKAAGRNQVAVASAADGHRAAPDTAEPLS